jgi:hypothetical protein
MVIPKEFVLFGQKIKVKIDTSILASDDAEGLALYRENTIKIAGHSAVWPQKTSREEQVFLHELVHFILYSMHEDDLRKNEKFVDVFASLLHQALITAKGVLK